MTVTLPDLMRETRNFFPTAALDASWTLKDGALSPSGGLPEGSWIALTGSALNNGVYQLGPGCSIPGARDENWTGRIWLLAPPADFLALAQKISRWTQAQGTCQPVKESFGAYSRELATDSSGLPITWQKYFAREMQPFRRMFTEVNV